MQRAKRVDLAGVRGTWHMAGERCCSAPRQTQSIRVLEFEIYLRPVQRVALTSVLVHVARRQVHATAALLCVRREGSQLQQLRAGVPYLHLKESDE